MKKNIYLINAHRNGLLMKDIFNILFKAPVGTKYNLLLEGLLQCDDVQVYNLITKEGCSVPKELKNIFSAYIESKFILYKNGYSSKIISTEKPQRLLKRQRKAQSQISTKSIFKSEISSLIAMNVNSMQSV